ncbi:MAG TPA: PspC domain-containing protein [Candidatus Saccharimonadales bacterium]
MKKVVTINLNGRAFQLEEDGYAALQAYLKQAQKKLAHDPEREDVLHDFEQAIAEKCEQFLKDDKTVVTAGEVSQIIADMGPVEIAEENEADAPKTDTPKRLYLIREGAILGGVCTGLGAYFNIDVNVVRLLFIILAIVTSGLGVVIYLLMMFFLPEAETPEEKASAHGQAYSAADLLERARSKYAELSSREHWQGVAKQASADGEQLHDASKDISGQVSKYVSETTRQALEHSQPAFTNVGHGIGKLARFAVRCWLGILTLIVASLSIAWFVTLWSIIASNRLWGYTIDPSYSRWLFGLWDSSCFLMLILPFFSLWLLGLRALHKDRTMRARRLMQYGAGVGWCVAIALTIAIPLCSPQLRNFTDWNKTKNGRLDFGAREYCYTKSAHNDYHFRDCTQ